MRVLVAGGTGFVGRHILTALLERGHRVTALSRSAATAPLPPGVETIAADITDPQSLRGRIAGHDAVIHSVGLIKNRRLKGQTFRRVVEEGTKNLVAEARLAGVRRFILQSANGVQPVGTSYQRTKWAAEQTVIDSGLSFTVFRPSFIFGPDDHLTTAFRKAMRWGAFPYFGRGNYKFAPVHADDVGHAIALSLATKEAENRVFHVCGPEVLMYRDILRAIKRASGSRAIIFPMPKLFARLGAVFLSWFPSFPATNESLTMLFEGSTCPEDAWRRVFGIRPKAFAETIDAWLAPRP